MATEETMVKVRVKVMKRDGYLGYYAIQRFFGEGEAEYMVPASKLEELKADTGPMVVVELSKDALDPDEKKMAAELEKAAGLKDHGEVTPTDDADATPKKGFRR